MEILRHNKPYASNVIGSLMPSITLAEAPKKKPSSSLQMDVVVTTIFNEVTSSFSLHIRDSGGTQIGNCRIWRQARPRTCYTSFSYLSSAKKELIKPIMERGL
jgi:hypothetical protein